MAPRCSRCAAVPSCGPMAVADCPAGVWRTWPWRGQRRGQPWPGARPGQIGSGANVRTTGSGCGLFRGPPPLHSVGTPGPPGSGIDQGPAMPRSAPLGRFSPAISVPRALVAGKLISKRLITAPLIAAQVAGAQVIASHEPLNQSIARRPVPNRQGPNPLQTSQLMDAPPKPGRSPKPGFRPRRPQAVGLEAGPRQAWGWLAGQARGEQP